VSFAALEALVRDLRTVRETAARMPTADTQHRTLLFELSHHACLMVVAAGSRAPQLLGCSCETRAVLLLELAGLAAWLMRYAQGRAFGWLPAAGAEGGAQCPAALRAVLQASTAALLALHAAGRGAPPAAANYAESTLYGLSRLLLAMPGEPGEPRLRADTAAALLLPPASSLGGPPPGVAAALHACTAALTAGWEEASGARVAALGCTLLLGLSRPPEAGAGPAPPSPLAAAVLDSELVEMARPPLLLAAEALGACWEGRAGGGCPAASAALLLSAGRVCRTLLRGRDSRPLMQEALMARAGRLLGSPAALFDARCGFGSEHLHTPTAVDLCVTRHALGLAAASLPLEQAATLASLLVLLAGADGERTAALLAACPSIANAERNVGTLLALAAHEARCEHLPPLYALHSTMQAARLVVASALAQRN